MSHWLLKRFLLRRFRQSGVHRRNVIAIYAIIREVLEDEFTEDNHPTLEAFSAGCHHQAWLAEPKPQGTLT